MICLSGLSADSAAFCLFIYLSIYLFNRFHHDYNAKIRQKKNTFEQGTKTRDEGAGHMMERGPKLSVPLRKIHTEILTMLTM